MLVVVVDVVLVVVVVGGLVFGEVVVVVADGVVVRDVGVVPVVVLASDVTGDSSVVRDDEQSFGLAITPV